ncbi:MAG TPA: phosphate ABC transporter substrate-binding protein [Candidatus Bathyarchaeia archaeon]|nr:phosphate ABC transporter substrate-binding protein [Candidatus Bathyarchaeia archaeon]
MKKILPIVLISLLVAVAVFGAGCTSSTNNSTGGASGSTLNLAGSTSVQPDAQALAQAYMANNSGITVNVAGGGTAAGITAVGTGTAQIGDASANLTASQLAQYPNLKPIPICVDAIGIIVNPQNTVTNLTLDQVRGIYNGTFTNWNQVGGSNAKINVVNREQGSGTRDGIQKIVLKGGNFSAGGIQQSSTGSVKSYVAGDANAIGYIATNALDNSVKALNINDVAPTYNNIANGSYVIQRYLLYVTNGSPTGLAADFINYTLSSAGQAILKGQGEVSLNDVPGYVSPTMTTATAATTATPT